MTGKSQRQHLLSTLAQSCEKNIGSYWDKLSLSPEYQYLKKPEIGMAMVRAKASSSKQIFNMGEMTVTRCVLQLTTGEIGFGYTGGRSKHKSTLIALIDACYQCVEWQSAIDENILRPLSNHLQQQKKKQQQETAESKVDFFTMVRGE